MSSASKAFGLCWDRMTSDEHLNFVLDALTKEEAQELWPYLAMNAAPEDYTEISQGYREAERDNDQYLLALYTAWFQASKPHQAQFLLEMLSAPARYLQGVRAPKGATWTPRT